MYNIYNKETGELLEQQVDEQRLIVLMKNLQKQTIWKTQSKMTYSSTTMLMTLKRVWKHLGLR